MKNAKVVQKKKKSPTLKKKFTRFYFFIQHSRVLQETPFQLVLAEDETPFNYSWKGVSCLPYCAE